MFCFQNKPIHSKFTKLDLNDPYSNPFITVIGLSCKCFRDRLRAKYSQLKGHEKVEVVGSEFAGSRLSGKKKIAHILHALEVSVMLQSAVCKT